MKQLFNSHATNKGIIEFDIIVFNYLVPNIALFYILHQSGLAEGGDPTGKARVRRCKEGSSLLGLRPCLRMRIRPPQTQTAISAVILNLVCQEST